MGTIISEKVWQKLLGLPERILGQEHLYTITATQGLAFLYWARKRYMEAENLIEKVLEFRLKLK